ncbi:hypothetical protein AS850_06430 [Frondihabitans sp. 762G35]|uniref:DUF2127 domain-containing protein n=1 Tax=Frondihabitans sp. 762G35 TaxID=1446794 RepID=UPI000D1FDC41|nr:DUF2127 domain-containing protein [Frondihabitans sp. 762G35]ARC56710.1 hypothetical protein AS850_06430 [Frondihabitans sp. 762G35]
MAPESATRTPTPLDRVFLWFVVIKGVDGLLELVGGTALLVIGPGALGTLARWALGQVLAADPDNALAESLRPGVAHLTAATTVFAGVYLLIHGVVKVVLWWAVARHRYGLYPWMIAVLCIFIGYQVYELAASWSWALAALTVFDVVIVWLTVIEYRRHRHPARVVDGADERSHRDQELVG